MDRTRNLASLLAVTFSVAYFLWFAGDGLYADFSGDDLMNLHHYWAGPSGALWKANLLYFSPYYRPLPGIIYLLFFDLFGLNPFPLRVFCFAILALNIILFFRFALQLSHSPEVAALATLIFSYHAWFVDLYYSSGTMYELLCFFFYFAALLYYLRIRQSGRHLQGHQWAVFSLLYVCALNSKEMAVTLPLLAAVLEFLLFPPKLLEQWSVKRWLAREGLVIWLGGLITVPYVVGKLYGSGSLVATSAYWPQVSLWRYMHTSHIYLNPLFYQDHWFRDANTLLLWVLMAAYAWWRRSAYLKFCWCFIMLSVLPFIFIPHHAAFFLYIPMAGWSVFGATLLVEGRDCVLARARRVSERGHVPVQSRGSHACRLVPVVSFLGTALLLGFAHASEQPKTFRQFMSVQPQPRSLVEQLSLSYPRLPKGTRILFLDDPYGQDYTLLFVFQLYYRDSSLVVDRVKRMPQMPSEAEVAGYDFVFCYRNGKLVRESRR